MKLSKTPSAFINDFSSPILFNENVNFLCVENIYSNLKAIFSNFNAVMCYKFAVEIPVPDTEL